jgi:phosphoglycolate phosphatase-like HAD superfamily hydrolase
VGTGNVIKQIFQEIYLGKDLFESTYGFAPMVYHGKGFITRERLLMERAVLEKLKKTHLLAIATGRPRVEAEYPIRHFGLSDFFQLIFSLDDCLEAEKKIYDRTGETVHLSKPDPFMLDAVKNNLKEKVAKCYYVGDMPDDMMAARRSASGFVGIGFLKSSPDKHRLKETLKGAGAEFIIEDFQDIFQIIS